MNIRHEGEEIASQGTIIPELYTVPIPRGAAGALPTTSIFDTPYSIFVIPIPRTSIFPVTAAEISAVRRCDIFSF